MDLTNKQINIGKVSVDHNRQQTHVSVTLTQKVLDGVFAKVGEYEMFFNDVYSVYDDPSLLSAIREKLALIA